MRVGGPNCTRVGAAGNRRRGRQQTEPARAAAGHRQLRGRRDNPDHVHVDVGEVRLERTQGRRARGVARHDQQLRARPRASSRRSRSRTRAARSASARRTGSARCHRGRRSPRSAARPAARAGRSGRRRPSRTRPPAAERWRCAKRSVPYCQRARPREPARRSVSTWSLRPRRYAQAPRARPDRHEHVPEPTAPRARELSSGIRSRR